MTQGRARCGPSFRTLISMAAAMAIAVGCMAADETPAVDTMVTDTTGTDTTGGGGTPPTTVTVRGRLDRPLDDYTGSAGRAAFERIVDDATNRWIGVEQDRECEGCPSSQSTRVAFHALDGVHGLDLDLAQGAPNGVVVARMVNRGNRVERLYRLEQSGSAIEAYYFVAEPVDPGTFDPNDRQAVLRLVGVPRNPTAPLRIEARGARRLRDCRHEDDANPTVTGADFTGCEPKSTRTDTSAAALLNKRTAPGWIACVHGCCEIGVS